MPEGKLQARFLCACSGRHHTGGAQLLQLEVPGQDPNGQGAVEALEGGKEPYPGQDAAAAPFGVCGGWKRENEIFA